MATASNENNKLKYRAIIEFLTLEGEDANNIHQRLFKVYAEEAPSRATVFRWNTEFKRGRKSLEDDPRSGRPVTVTTPEIIDSMRELLDEDRRITVESIAEQVNISIGAVHNIIHNELQMTKVTARWVPRKLTEQNKWQRVESSRALLKMYEADQTGFESRFITGDETWLHHYDPETKLQSMQWKSRDEPTPVKFKTQASAGKVLATIFWDRKGPIMCDYLQRGHTVTGQYYADLLENLRQNIREKRSGMLTAGVLVLQDNAPAHTSAVATAAARRCGFEILPHPPYSPDMAPCDYFLFPNLKLHLKGQHYASDQEVITAANGWLESQTEDFYLGGLRDLSKRLTKCIDLNGDYVEK